MKYFKIIIVSMSLNVAVVSGEQDTTNEPTSSNIVDRIMSRPSTVLREAEKSMSNKECLALANAIQKDGRLLEPYRRGISFSILSLPVCQESVRLAELLLDDISSENEIVSSVAGTHVLILPSGDVLSLLSAAFVDDPRLRRLENRRSLSILFAQIGGPVCVSATEALLLGVIDEDGEVQSNCALAISQCSLEIQARAVGSLATIWRAYRASPTFRVVRAIRCAVLFNRTVLKDFGPEFERLALNSSVDSQIQAAAGGAIFHSGHIERGLEIIEQGNNSIKTVLLGELKNVFAQRNDFLKQDPVLALQLRHIVRSSLHAKDAGVRKAALQALYAVYGNEFLLKSESGEWDLHPEVRASLVDLVNNESDESFVEQARGLLDKERTLGWLIAGAKEREMRRSDSKNTE